MQCKLYFENYFILSYFCVYFFGAHSHSTLAIQLYQKNPTKNKLPISLINQTNQTKLCNLIG